MEEDLRHVQQALEGLEQQLSCLAKGVKDLRKEEEANLELKGMGAQLIKIWSFMKQSLRNRFGVGNHEGQQGQAKVKFMEPSIVEKEEQREKEIVVLEKSEEVNFYANETNSLFASEF
ncbi:hypothetical protein M9H77_21843 [Catharanthus roseus]|uniref:Uncharacterized protein n=1 Tax=Catharanthus roseus TaxID=4058 RepID=A0ACC0AQ80_CATRO|nr:hypothetical protein M9H77_21843 [Catharanthus roseus]